MLNLIVGRYSAALKRSGGVRRALSTYGIFRLIDGGLKEAGESLGARVLHLLGRRPGTTYGWIEALLSPASDIWCRYGLVVDALTKDDVGKFKTVVEVSSGGRGGIAWPLRGRGFQVCLVDWSAALLKDARGGNAWRVCADAGQLPFSDNSFDAAVSLDTLEHLPHARRAAFTTELKRIAKQTVILTCPLQSKDGQFQARECDLQLTQDIASKNQPQPAWLKEHVVLGHPTREECDNFFPNAKIIASESCAAWLKYARFYQRMFLWPLTGIYYLSLLKKSGPKAPYRRGLVVWQKREPVNEELIRS